MSRLWKWVRLYPRLVIILNWVRDIEFRTGNSLVNVIKGKTLQSMRFSLFTLWKFSLHSQWLAEFSKTLNHFHHQKRLSYSRFNSLLKTHFCDNMPPLKRKGYTLAFWVLSLSPYELYNEVLNYFPADDQVNLWSFVSEEHSIS